MVPKITNSFIAVEDSSSGVSVGQCLYVYSGHCHQTGCQAARRRRERGGEEGGIKFTVCSEPDCVLLKLFGRSLNRARRKMSVLRINYFVCQSWIKKIFHIENVSNRKKFI